MGSSTEEDTHNCGTHNRAMMDTPALGRLGWRRAKDAARPANLGALVAAVLRVRGMDAAAAHAGLL
eukprot:9347246-Pyramimonas_sp.AAC.1